MKKLVLTSVFSIAFNLLFAQVDIRDSVFVLINKLEPYQFSFALNNIGKIDLVHIHIKNKYEVQSGYVTGYFDSNLTLKQKHTLDPKKILTYEEYVKLINKDFMNVYYHYKVYFILSEAKYDYLTLQVRHITPPQFNEE